MKMDNKLWLVALVVCLPLIWGTSSAWAAPASDHLPQTKTPQSVRFSIEGTVDTSGGTIPLRGSGAVSGSDFMLDLEMSAPPGTAGPEKITVGMISKGDKLYLKLPDLLAGEDAKWYVSDRGQVGGLDAVMGLDMDNLHKAMKVKSTAKESLNGTAVTRYNIEVDSNALDPFGQQPLPEGPQFDTTMFLTLWVGDSDMYVHKLNVNVESVATVGETTSFVRMNMVLTFSGFDTLVTIEAPADAEVLDFEGALGGTPLGGILGGGVGRPIGMPTTGSGPTAGPWGFGLLLLSLMSLAGGIIIRRRAALRYQTITNKDRFWTEHSK